MTYRETLKTPPKKLLEPINGFSKAARYKFNILKKNQLWTFLVVQWLRVCLPMQGTWACSLVLEDSTCHRATEPVHFSC